MESDKCQQKCNSQYGDPYQPCYHTQQDSYAHAHSLLAATPSESDAKQMDVATELVFKIRHIRYLRFRG